MNDAREDRPLQSAVAKMLAQRADEPALAFDGRWRPWRWYSRIADLVDQSCAQGGLAKPAWLALVSRNRPAHVGLFAAQCAARRMTAMVYAAKSPEGIAADIRACDPPVVAADPVDWTPELHAACQDIGAIGLSLHDDGEQPIRVVGGLERWDGRTRRDPGNTGFEMLTSGTTGNPKRLPLSWASVESAVRDAASAYSGTGQTDAPLILLHPLGNIAGVAYLAPALANGQPIVLLEKFSTAAWADAVREYRPVRSALPPAAVRMVLDTGVPHADLASLQVVVVGGAAIDPELQERFEAHYGIDVLTAFGATEFGGVIANWTLPLYREFKQAKRGSCGRASANVELRIVDKDTFAVLPPDGIGLLEAKVTRMGDHWIRTNDLASLDADGFLFLHGRADDAINRGGFKIVPAKVVAALKALPGVADAAVVGLPDDRLGQVPVAAVELSPGSGEPTPAELLEGVRKALIAYEVPVDLKIVSALPRNASMKISAPDVVRLFAKE